MFADDEFETAFQTYLTGPELLPSPQDQLTKLNETVAFLTETIDNGCNDIIADGATLFSILCTTAARVGLDAEEFGYWVSAVNCQLRLVQVAPLVQDVEPF